MRKVLISLLCALALAVPLSAQSTTSITATHVADPSGTAIASGLLCFMPVDATDKITGFRSGSTQVAAVEKCFVVSNGVMQSGATVVPTPAGIYYHIRLRNRQQTTTIMRDYGMTVITGSSWTLDTYDPSMAVLPVQTITVGTVTQLSPGSSPTATITGSNPLLLNLGIPQGQTGATGSPCLATVTQATGTVDGTNTVFTFSKPASPTPVIAVFVNGQLFGASGDYTLAYSGSNTWTITFAIAPTTGPVTLLIC